jgi:hypothetical protein
MNFLKDKIPHGYQKPNCNLILVTFNNEVSDLNTMSYAFLQGR